MSNTDAPTTGLPRRLGDFELERSIGVGAVGEVFAARDLETGDQVALKTLVKNRSIDLARIKNEFRSLHDVSHRNLIRLHKLVSSDEGTTFMTMELLSSPVTFVEWIRGATPAGQLPDLERLEDAFGQLVAGVHALHQHGLVHRDLKPANVLVTTSGRVVVLDFGIVSELDTDLTLDGQIVGTAAYMAPEQAARQPLGTAADAYAIGVMLFEAITGRLPHGASLYALSDKQRQPTMELEPALLAAPARLRDLCLRLLSRDPEARPSTAAMLQLAEPSPPSRRRVFVARDRELVTLTQAFDEFCATRKSKLVHVLGPTGYGKSALLRRFRAYARDQGALVLHGCCLGERERVPFKGLDAVIDSLSWHLRRLPHAERRRLEPPDLDVLVRMFPVLDEIWSPVSRSTLALAEARKLGGATLGKLLRSLGEGRPLVIQVDDVQWTDDDTVGLLSQLQRLPAAPTWMLVFSYCTDTGESEALTRLRDDEALAGPHRLELELDLLTLEDARALAEALLPRDACELDQRRARVEAIALCSRGNPLYITQLTRSGRSLSAIVDGDLDVFVKTELQLLDPASKRVLELMAVFGSPIAPGFACELCADVSAAVFGSLLGIGLVVHGTEHGDKTDERFELVHSRVRELILESLEPEARARLHWRIGEGLQRGVELDSIPDARLFELVNHLEAGRSASDAMSTEQRVQLARLIQRAAERALSSSAYSTAQRYLEVARELLGPELELAQAGKGEVELCVAVTFTGAQTELALANERASDQITRELLIWDLGGDAFARVAAWYVDSLALRSQADCVGIGSELLARLGHRLVAGPSWLRAIASFIAGVLSLRRDDYRTLRTRDVPAGTRDAHELEILSVMTRSAFYTDIKSAIYVGGRYARELARHGFHDEAGSALVCIAVILAKLGRGHEGKRLFELVRGLVEKHHRQSLVYDAVICSVAVMFEPRRQVLQRCQTAQRRVDDGAPLLVSITAFGVIVMVRLMADANIASLRRDIQTFFTRNFGGEADLSRDDEPAAMRPSLILSPLAIACDLIDGSSLCETVLARERTGARIALHRGMAFVGAILCAIMLGRSERAWALWSEMSAGDRNLVIDVPGGAINAMLFALVLIDIRPRLRGRERRDVDAELRRYRANLRHAVGLCPENFLPMLELLEAELANMRGGSDAAVRGLERARELASEAELPWLVALASERLAKLAQQRGQSLLANAAFEAARSAYAEWGATAIVARLDAERA